MRKFYRTRRNRVVQLLEGCAFADQLTILELDAGLHFLLQVDTALSDRELTEKLARVGIHVHALSHYYHETEGNTHMLVVNYALLNEEDLEKALGALAKD
jgi:GntR family transcriptional regulator/MocR family aminotransferase